MEKIKVTMILENGKEIKFSCDDFNYTINNKTGCLDSYKVVNVSPVIDNGIPVYVDIDKIVAITVLNPNPPQEKLHEKIEVTDNE